MDYQRPTSRPIRILIHLWFGMCLLATLIYFVRATQERHIALGFHGTTSKHFVFVKEGSVAEKAGIRVGDVLDNPTRSWLVGFLSDDPTYSFLAFREDSSLQIDLPIQYEASLEERLAAVPSDLFSSTIVGILSLLLGWWIFARNPDHRGIIVFALWSGSTSLFWIAQFWSAYWSFDMWSFNTIWSIPAETAFQVFAIHWLLAFPQRLVRNRTLIVIYSIFVVLTAALFVVAILTADKPTDWMSIKGMAVALTVITLCLVQLRRSSTLKVRRQAAWVLFAILFFSLVSFFLWDAPYLAGISLPITDMTVTNLVAFCYLAIPAGIAIAITREGLFRIDRIVTNGMAIGATLTLMFLVYVGFIIVLAGLLNLDDRSSLPTFWGFVVVCGIAVLVRPVHRSLEKAFDQVFSRRQRQLESALHQFDVDSVVLTDRESLAQLTCRTIADGLQVTGCSISDARIEHVIASPGALSIDGRVDDIEVDEALPASLRIMYPIAISNHYFGTALIGPKKDDMRFTDEDLVFLERLALRCADQDARMELQAAALRKELEFAKTRLRIASDLHDDIGSNLSGIALMSESAADDPAGGRERLLQISRFARSMVDSLRDIVWSIDPESDSAGHLIGRMRDAASTLLGGIHFTVDAPDTLDGQISPVFQRNVFLIFKEALNNAARHSGASEVRIVVRCNPDFEMTVADNGAGFDTERPTRGLGRRSMQARAEQIGADLSIQSSPGSGTVVKLRAKMAQTRHD